MIYDSERQRVLLARRKRDGLWVIPGGGVEKEESAEEAAVREVKEETGFDVRVINELGIYLRPQWRAHGREGDKTTVYLCEIIGGEFSENDEISEIRWFDVDALPGEMPPWHLQRIKDARDYVGRPFVRVQPYSTEQINSFKL